MPPEQEFALAWLHKAKNDVLSGKAVLKSEYGITDVPCFHAQQAVEKTLKGFLTWHGVSFGKTHDLMILLSEVVRIHPAFDIYRSVCEELSEFAVEVRYPGGISEPPQGEAERFIAEAGNILIHAERVLKSPPRFLPEHLILKTKKEYSYMKSLQKIGSRFVLLLALFVGMGFTVPAYAASPQTITFPPIADREASVVAFDPGATASSGLKGSYTVVTGQAFVVNGKIVAATPGIVTLCASQPGNENYSAATPVDRTFTVTGSTNVHYAVIAAGESHTVGLKTDGSLVCSPP